EATARMYVEKGAKVAIFDMNEERGQSLVEELGVAYFDVNVCDEAAVQNAISGTVSAYGAIHICNNFAGIGHGEKTVSKGEPHKLETFSKIINVNLIGTFNVARLAAAQMVTQDPVTDDGGRGVIINTASIAGYEGQIGQAAYSASKGGVIGMALTIARDLAADGIRCNTIVPGLIHTPLFDQLPENVYQSLEASVLGPQRLGKPEEIAHLSCYLVENDYMNGESVRMDGGIRMQPR
ncbi:MAG: SDR family oxidoreductase, partial [Pseudomonadota bacterium]